MDTVTHGLTGVLISEMGFRQKLGLKAEIAIVTGSLVPDIDILWSSFNNVTALEYHRGFTHSLVTGAALLLIVTGISIITRRFKILVKWTALAFLGFLSHIFLDLATSYGTQIFHPLSSKRYYLDLIFIIDPFITFAILFALILSLVNKRRAITYTRVCAVYLILYFFFMIINHEMALYKIRNSSTLKFNQTNHISTLPQPFKPFGWTGIVTTDEGFYKGNVNILSWRNIEFEFFKKDESSRYIDIAKATHEAQIFYSFARFPVVKLKEENGKIIAELSDLRFLYRVGRKVFVLRIIMNKNGEVESVLFNR